MDYTVVKGFTCKLTKKNYSPGDTYATNDTERAQLLIRKRKLAAEANQKKAEPGPDKPASPVNFKRVKGKEAAKQEIDDVAEGD